MMELRVSVRKLKMKSRFNGAGISKLMPLGIPTTLSIKCLHQLTQYEIQQTPFQA